MLLNATSHNATDSDVTNIGATNLHYKDYRFKMIPHNAEGLLAFLFLWHLLGLLQGERKKCNQ
jgi:hypothetical protein